MRNSLFIKIQTVPLLEQIEQSDRKSEPHLEICPNSLAQMFQFTNLPKQRENRFNQHSIVPLATPTDFQVFRLSSATAKGGVSQNDHFVTDGFGERQKFLIRNICLFNLPIGDKSEFVGQQTEFATDNPFPRSKAFLADSPSMWLMILSDWMTKLDAVRINHTENGRFRQKLFGQSPMRLQAAKRRVRPGKAGKSLHQFCLSQR